jgi:enoyl-CoA hydratase
LIESYTLIRVEVREHLAEVVLDNPGRLNAMGTRFFHEIRDAFTKLDRDSTVHAIIVWAEGRVFSSGLNLKEAAGLIPERDSDLSDAARNRVIYDTILDFQSCFSQIQKTRQPVIAAVHGLCIGGGLDLATACDMRLCSNEASFAIQETKIAMVADLGSLQRITRLVGRGLARELAFTGKLLSAERALKIGLVNEVYPDKESLLRAAREMAREIAANSPLVVQGIKQVLEYSEAHSEAEGLEYVAHWNASFFLSHDLFEAVRAFNEKRDPNFKGT